MLRLSRTLQFLLMWAAAALGACDNVPGTREYAIKMAQARAAELLLDPSSAVFTDVVAYGSQNERVCGTINGRNRIGGYAEPVRFVSSPSLTALGPNSSNEDGVERCLFDAAWDFYCAVEPGPAIATAGCR